MPSQVFVLHVSTISFEVRQHGGTCPQMCISLNARKLGLPRLLNNHLAAKIEKKR